MRDVVIVSAVRTAIGNFGGGLKNVSATDLAITVMKESIKRAGIKPDQVEEVIFGNILSTCLGQNFVRQASVYSDIPVEVPCFAVNKLCGSGMKCVELAVQAIQLGESDIILAGGSENMSRTPYALDEARWGARMGNGKLIDLLLKDGLFDAFNDYHMGITAENVAEKYNISREDQDKAALASQHKACAAIKSGAFKDEIVPVVVKGRKGDTIFDTDEFPKEGTTLEGLSKLKPAFKKDGTVTAGNASGISDGAAALIIMSADKAKELGLKPMAKILSYASVGVDPAYMGIGPIPSSRKALAKAGLTIKDMDLVEANEAFAAQFVYCGRELGFDMDKVNVNGGAIALGHPIGCSGARILVTLLYALKARGLKKGLATLCIGGGQGTATVIEML